MGKSRKTLSLLGALGVLLLVLAACGGDDTATDAPDGADGAAETDDPADTEDADTDGEDAGAGGEVEGDDVTLNLGHPFPAGHPIQVALIEPFAEQVSEVTNGTVTVEIHPGGALAAPPATFDNTATGVMDMGWALHGYTPGRFPLTDVVELPHMFDSAVQATEVLWDLYEEFDELQQEYEGVKVLALWTHDIGDLFTREQPVQSLDDMQGLSLRAPGPVQTELIDALGGSGVGLPAPELYDALERGVIDGLMIANTGIESFTLHEVLSYGTRANFYVAGQFLVMNQQSWDQLSDSQQQAIEGVIGRDLSLQAARAYDEEYEEVITKFEDWGMDITVLEGAELEEWREASRSVVEDWIAERESEGQPGQALHDRMLELTGD